MPARLDLLTAAQRRAVTHEGSPLLVLGGAGTGKTRVLIERFAWLVDQGVPHEDLLLVAPSDAAAGALRRQVEDLILPPYGELAVVSVPSLCLLLLREHAPAAGVDPFFVPATAADRLALLLDRVEQLTLRRHDFLGNPAAMLGSVIERIDRCKLELVTADDYTAWAAGLEGQTGEREREFAQLYCDHDRLLAEEGTLDSGDLVLRSLALLERARADIGALAEIAVRIGALADAHPEIAELDLNPVMVGPDGAPVVDARVRVAPPAVQPVFPAVGR